MTVHPFHAYDKRYFSEGNVPSYARLHFKLAQAFYQAEQHAVAFIPQFIPGIENERRFERRLTIQELSHFAKNPLKTYLRSLGLYLPKEKKWDANEKISLDDLDLYFLRKAVLTGEQEVALMMPYGPFKKQAFKQILGIREEILGHLENVSLKPEQIFSIELKEGIQETKKISATAYQTAPLLVPRGNGEVVAIVGKLEMASQQGLIALSKNECPKAIQHYPEFLVYDALIKRESDFAARTLFFARTGDAKNSFTDHPEKGLADFLDYYLHGSLSPSPLFPEWAAAMLKGDAQTFRKQVDDSLKRSFNEELLWWMRNQPDWNSDLLFDQWQPVARSLFSQLYEGWYV